MAAAAAAGQAAALPWAAVQLEGGEAPAVDRDLPATLGLQLGARVEVQWSIHVEQEGGGEAETTQARRAAPDWPAGRLRCADCCNTGCCHSEGWVGRDLR